MTVLSVLIGLATLATVVALGAGVVSMAHGGKFDDRHSAQLMFARVGAQGVALFLLLAALLLSLN